MATEPIAPPVVAVVVACDPGPWFEDALAALAAQDYPNLSVLVVDVANDDDLTPRVAAAVPGAFVHRVDRRVPFGVAANEALRVVEGASHLLLCHDDVALAPDAVRVLVEEAFRSNAGMVTPKLVAWEAPDRLVAVGVGADRFGVTHPLVEPGELDQEQHDGVRDVFVAPSAAALVRADLFSAVGGYDPAVPDWGDDLDLSWRVQVAGARIVTAPLARVRHLAATDAGLRRGSGGHRAREAAGLARERHRLHTALACAGALRLVVVLPLLVVHAVAEAVGLALTGRGSEAGAPLRALVAVLGHPGGVVQSRRRVRRVRQTGDTDIRHLQSSGSVRFRTWLRTRLEEGPRSGPALADAEASALALTAADLDTTGAGDTADGPIDGAARSEDPATRSTALFGPGSWRLAGATLAVIAALLLIGTRSLLGAHLPSVGQLPVGGGTVGGWWAAWWSTWRTAGLGSTGPGAPGLALLAALASVVGRSAAVHLAVLGPLVLGPLGAARAARAWGSPRARLAAALAYGTVAVPYDALAAGRWGGLVAFGAAPWLVGGVGALAGGIPHPARSARSVAGRVVTLGVVVAVVATVAPSFVFVAVAVGVGVALGAISVGAVPAAGRALAVAGASAVVAAVVLEPWWFSLLGHRAALFGVAPAGPAPGLGQLLHFHTGPVGGALGWGVVAAAALPLVVGRDWRLAWAARSWGVAVVCVGLAWAGGRGWVPAPAPEVLLAPAAAALAAAVGLGVVAFEMDLPGYQLGWRQAAAALAAVAATVSAVPVIVAAGDGRWHLPDEGIASTVALPDTTAGDFRVLWVGAPGAVPLPSATFRKGVGFATTWDGGPGTSDEWAAAPGGSTPALGHDLALVADRLTTNAGHLLAAAGVRYLVVPAALAPPGDPAAGGGATVGLAAPGDLLQGLARQTDLRAVPADAGITVFEDTAWSPARAAFPTGRPLPADPSPRAAQLLPPAGGRAVLRGGARGASGRVPAPSEIYIAGTPGGWQLHVGRRTLTSARALGVGAQVAVPAAPARAVTATLSAPGSGADRAAQVVEIAIWALTAGLVGADRRRRRSGGPETADPAWFTREVAHPRRDRRPPASPARPSGPAFADDEEVWSGA